MHLYATPNTESNGVSGWLHILILDHFSHLVYISVFLNICLFGFFSVMRFSWHFESRRQLHRMSCDYNWVCVHFVLFVKSKFITLTTFLQQNKSKTCRHNRRLYYLADLAVPENTKEVHFKPEFYVQVVYPFPFQYGFHCLFKTNDMHDQFELSILFIP